MNSRIDPWRDCNTNGLNTKKIKVSESQNTRGRNEAVKDANIDNKKVILFFHIDDMKSERKNMKNGITTVRRVERKSPQIIPSRTGFSSILYFFLWMTTDTINTSRKL